MAEPPAPAVPVVAGPVRLRRLALADVDLLVALDADPEVIRYLYPRPPARAEIEQHVRELLVEYDRYPGFGTWAAHLETTGEFIGFFSLHVAGDDQRDRPELGYRLRRALWGRGLATSVCTQLLESAFTRLGSDLVWAQTMMVNAGSRRVLEKCGLRHVRTTHPSFDVPLPGTDEGEAEYEITRSEWRARTAGPRHSGSGQPAE